MWIGAKDLSERELEQIRQDHVDKEAFAVALIHWPRDPLQAALTVEPYNSHRALYIAQFWPDDLYVKAHLAKLLTSVDQLLPSKVQLVFKAMKIADDLHASPETKLKALRLITDMQQFTGPASGQALTSNQIGVALRVLEVPLAPSTDEWEKVATGQQDLLTTSYRVDDE